MSKPTAFTEFNKQILEHLKAAVDAADPSQWMKPWKRVTSLPTNLLTGNIYRGGNAFSLMMSQMFSDYTSPYWFTFKQMKELEKKYGQNFKFRQGQHGQVCVRWVEWIPPCYKETKGGYVNIETGEFFRKDQVQRLVPRYFKVFNLDQFEEVPDEYCETDEPVSQYLEAEQFIQATGAHIKAGNVDHAYNRPSTNTIVVPFKKNFSSEAGYFATLFHELTHWTGDDGRCDRDKNTSTHEGKAYEELVAEMGALLLCAQFNIEGEAQHAEYLASWLSALKGDEHYFWDAAKDAQKAVDWLNNLTHYEVQHAQA